MANLLSNHCFKCGVIDDPVLYPAGPHIKQVCQHCGFYKKFASIHELPSIDDVKIRIWEITNQNLQIINIQKEGMCFVEELDSYKLRFLQYWQLYINIKKTMAYLAK